MMTQNVHIGQIGNAGVRIPEEGRGGAAGLSVGLTGGLVEQASPYFIAAYLLVLVSVAMVLLTGQFPWFLATPFAAGVLIFALMTHPRESAEDLRR